MLQVNSDIYYYIHKLSKYSTQPQVVNPIKFLSALEYNVLVVQHPYLQHKMLVWMTVGRCPVTFGLVSR